MNGKMNTVKLIATGDVQRVGYRNAVSQVARKFGIMGQVRNLENEDVEIIAQGSKDLLKKFSKAVRIQDWPIQVETICEETLSTTTAYSKFKIIREEPLKEIAERADESAQYLKQMRKEMAKEETLQKLARDCAKEETLQKLAKNAAKEETLKKGFKGLENVVSKEETLKEGFSRLEKTVSKEETLEKQANTMEKFADNTDTEFKDLDKKYGSISQKLDKLDQLETVAEKLDKLSDAILALVQHK